MQTNFIKRKMDNVGGSPTKKKAIQTLPLGIAMGKLPNGDAAAAGWIRTQGTAKLFSLFTGEIAALAVMDEANPGNIRTISCLAISSKDADKLVGNLGDALDTVIPASITKQDAIANVLSIIDKDIAVDEGFTFLDVVRHTIDQSLNTLVKLTIGKHSSRKPQPQHSPPSHSSSSVESPSPIRKKQRMRLLALS